MRENTVLLEDKDKYTARKVSVADQYFLLLYLNLLPLVGVSSACGTFP